MLIEGQLQCIVSRRLYWIIGLQFVMLLTHREYYIKDELWGTQTTCKPPSWGTAPLPCGQAFQPKAKGPHPNRKGVVVDTLGGLIWMPNLSRQKLQWFHLISVLIYVASNNRWSHLKGDWIAMCYFQKVTSVSDSQFVSTGFTSIGCHGSDNGVINHQFCYS